ncbi:MAG: DUF7666 domain-containing protein [bacterium]
MIAYKGTKNQKCINLTYEVGKTYTFTGELEIWKRGFHFCKEFINTSEDYSFSDKDTQILEIEVLGEIIDEYDLSVTNKFKVLRIIPRSEWSKITDAKLKFDENGDLIYLENSNKFWKKYKYDKNNNEIYFEHSDGFWTKYKYDKSNNLIYCENSDLYWEKYKYDKNNNLIYKEIPSGFWEKYEYDKNNNLIYHEDSLGLWEKYQYNQNNNVIDYENSYKTKYSIIIE